MSKPVKCIGQPCEHEDKTVPSWYSCEKSKNASLNLLVLFTILRCVSFFQRMNEVTVGHLKSAIRLNRETFIEVSTKTCIEISLHRVRTEKK